MNIDAASNRSNNSSKVIGDNAEKIAEAWLHARGYTTICQNWKVRQGEIDIVMHDPSGDVVCVEVRYRKLSTEHSALYSVGSQKIERMLRSAALYQAYEDVSAPIRVALITLSGEPPRVDDWVDDIYAS